MISKHSIWTGYRQIVTIGNRTFKFLTFENKAHIIAGLVGILFNMSELICQLCIELKD